MAKKKKATKRKVARRARVHWHKDGPFSIIARQRRLRVKVIVEFERLVKSDVPIVKEPYSVTNRNTELADGIMLAMKRTDADFRLSTMYTQRGRG